MRESWRWFGPEDPVTINDIRQTGATDIVSALHAIPAGEVWPLEAIRKHQALIEDCEPSVTALKWTVVESIPVHEDIKLALPGHEKYIDNWIASMDNLAQCGIKTICYNFMPVIDWTRTDLKYKLPSGAYALRFDQKKFAAFDIFILKRENVSAEYSASEIAEAKQIFEAMSEDEREDLTQNIIAGLPGKMTESYGLDDFRAMLAKYKDVSRDVLRQNLFAFLSEVLPRAEAVGIKLAIHPDDPPRDMLGLPRIICTADDLEILFKAQPSPSNGITLCVGTYGSRPDNDLPAMARQFGPRIHFSHLRGVSRDAGEQRSFFEASHLDSDIDMVGVIAALLGEEARRAQQQPEREGIFIRPDHGHQMMDDNCKSVNPGYSGIGRLKGLAEVRGVIRALSAQNGGCIMTEVTQYTARQKIARGLALFLPGIFLLGFNIGTGSITAMSKAGAEYGMSLLWTIVASCLCTYFMINLYGRYTLVTGETALQAFRKHIHPAVGIFFIVALTFGVCGSVMGVMGIVAEICHAWSKTVVDGGIAPIYFAAFFVTLVFFIFWNGKTEFFERSLAVIVAVMAASFLINFFIMMPPPVDIIKGMIPSLPKVDAGSDGGPLLVIASMVGTTVFSGLFIIRTTLVKEAGWTLKDEKTQRNDAIVAVALMFVISAAVMAAAAGTLFVEGIGLSNASQMIELLEPLAGSFAPTIFAVGIVSAGVSSQFPNVLMLPWLICDYTGAERDMSLPKYRVMVFLISLLGLVVPLFGGRPVLVMIVSQAFNAVILPITVACIFYLSNRVDLMGAYKNKLASNIILSAILLFSLFTSLIGVKGVWQVISG